MKPSRFATVYGRLKLRAKWHQLSITRGAALTLYWQRLVSHTGTGTAMHDPTRSDRRSRTALSLRPCRGPRDVHRSISNSPWNATSSPSSRPSLLLLTERQRYNVETSTEFVATNKSISILAPRPTKTVKRKKKTDWRITFLGSSIADSSYRRTNIYDRVAVENPGSDSA